MVAFLMSIHHNLSTAHKSRFLLDRYEKCVRDALDRIDPLLPLIELGAGLGVVSCLSNKILSKPQNHIVVEANPFLLPLLYHNREQNGCKFTILNNAIAYGGLHNPFYQARSFIESGMLQPNDHEILVPGITLQQVANLGGYEKFTLICDVEGSESLLFQNETKFFAGHVSLLIMEIHTSVIGDESIKTIVHTLQSMGYKIDWIGRKTLLGNRM